MFKTFTNSFSGLIICAGLLACSPVFANKKISNESRTKGLSYKQNKAALSALALNIGTLSPDFNANVTDYTATVNSTVQSIRVIPAVSEDGVSITVNDVNVESGELSAEIPLTTGENLITVKLSVGEDVTATYNIVVTKLKSSNAFLSNLTISEGSLSPEFFAGTAEYGVTVSNTTSSVEVTPTLAAPGGTVTVNSSTTVSGSPSLSVDLNVGPNIIYVESTAEDGTTKTYTITVTRAGSDDATLSNLTVNGSSLNPSFDSGTTNYTVNAPNNVTAIDLTPTVNSPYATVKINGQDVVSGNALASVPLAIGDNTFDVAVTAQSGTVKIYTIIVTRAQSSNALLSSLAINHGNLSPVFDAATNAYTANVFPTTTAIVVTPTVADATATITVNGAAVVSGNASDAIALEYGENIINVAVTAQDGTTLNTYSLIVTRKLSANAKLSNLVISAGDLSPAFDAATASYTLDVGNDVATLDITPTVAEAHAAVTVNGQPVTSGSALSSLPLSAGDNVFEIAVTAQNGTTNSYTITVTRAASSNALLSNLTLDHGKLSPVFDAATTNYTVNVFPTTTAIQITPTAADANAIVTVNGGVVVSGNSSEAIALEYGENDITVSVMAQDGSTISSYVIVVNRKLSVNAKLSNLITNAGDLSPVFDTATTAYTLSLSNDVAAIDITPTVAEEHATVTVNGQTITSGEALTALPLNVGVNTFEVTVTAQSGTTNTYAITVTRAKSSEAHLATLSVDQGGLNPDFDPAVTDYGVNVGSDVDKIVITATSASSAAGISIDETTIGAGESPVTIDLNYGDNNIALIVTAEDSTVLTYNLKITRAPHPDDILSNLSLSAGTLSPEFNTGSKFYSATVGADVTSTSVVAQLSGTYAQIEVNGQAVESGDASPDISLNYGVNLIKLKVTGSSGAVTNYTIAVTKQAEAPQISYGDVDGVLHMGHEVALQPNVSGGAIPSTPFGTVNTYANDLGGTHGLAFDGVGNLYLADSKEGGIMKIAPESDGGERTIIGPHKNAKAIAVSRDGTIYAAYDGEDFVTKITSDGAIMQIGSGLPNIKGIAVAPNGFVYLTDGDKRTYKIFYDNTIYGYWIGFAGATGIAVDADNNAYVTSATGIYKQNLEMGGASVPVGDISTLNDVVVDASGNIYATDNLNSKIIRVATDGTRIELGNGDIKPGTGGIAIGPNGNLFVRNAENSKVKEITLTGFTISPALPEGLTFDGGTGLISGAPLAPFAGGDYKVTAISNGQSASTIIHLSGVSDAGLSKLAISSGELSQPFDKTLLEYSAAVENSVSSLTLTPTADDSTVTVTVNGLPVVSESASADIPLQVGDNTITVTAIAAGMPTASTYTITIHRAASSNANLGSLTLNNGDLPLDFSADNTEYHATAETAVAVLNIVPATEDGTAAIVINGQQVTTGEAFSQDLQFGDNQFTINVTAQDSTVKTYTLTVTRAQSSDATLASLTLNGGNVPLDFSPDNTEYYVTVDAGMSSVTVAPAVNNANATVTVNGSTVDTGSTGEVSLQNGENFITIVVTARDGSLNSYNVIVNRSLSTDAALASLVINNGDVPLNFIPETTEYTVTVAPEVESVNVAPVAHDPTAAVTVNNFAVDAGAFVQVPLQYGENSVSVSVTAQDSSVRNYTVTVIRAKSVDASLSALSLTNVTLSPAFSSGHLVYSATVENSITSTKVTATASAQGASIKINGSVTQSGLQTKSISLAEGTTTLTTIVTAPDGVTTGTYQVQITRKKSNDATLSGLTVSSGVLSPAFVKTTTTYTTTVSDVVAGVSVTPMTTDAGATIKVNGKAVKSGVASDNIALTALNNVVTIAVTAADGTTVKNYTLTVTRTAPVVNNANLSALALANVTMSPVFATNTTTYTATVDYSVNSTIARYATSDSKATVTVNGKAYKSGLDALPLVVGPNVITTVVTAKDGKTKKTYTVTVSRALGEQTITFPATTKAYGDADFSPATASSGLPVTYTSADTKIISVVNGKLHILASGSVKITAAQAGVKGQYNAAKAVAQTINVSIGSQKITFSPVTKTYGDADFSPAIVSSNLPVTYTSSNLNVISVVGGKLHIVGMGTASITASQPGVKNQYAAAASVKQVVTVNIGSQVITFAAVTKGFGEADFSPATASSNLPVTYTSSNTGVISVVNGKLHITGIGTANITAAQGGVKNQYSSAASVIQKVTVTKGKQTITFSQATHTYGDADFIPATSSSGLPLTFTSNNTKIATIVNGKVHIVAAGAVSLIATQGGNAQYEQVKADNQLSIGKATLTIKADDKSIKAGQQKPTLTATITGFVKGETKTILTKQPTLATNAVLSKPGSYTITASGAAAANYVITYVSGKLTVTAATTKTTDTQGANIAVTVAPAKQIQQLPQPLVHATLSPNGDGVNDILIIDNIENFADNKLMVVDANGNTVYQTTGYGNGNVFDGHSIKTHALLTQGTYYYVLEYQDQGESKRLTGYVVLKY